MFFIIIEYPVEVITDQSLQLEIMQSIHAWVGETKQVQSTGGHLGQNKIYERVTKRYYWPRVTQDVANFINSCHKCQVVKEVHLQKTNAKLHSVVVPNKIWCQIAIDLMVSLKPGPYGPRNILMVIDYFTKWPEIIPLKTKTAKELPYHLYKLLGQYRCPEVIISNQGMFTHHCLKIHIQQHNLHVCQ